MIGKRYIDGERLVKLIEDRIGSAPDVKRWLKRQPRLPEVVSSQGAAAILGVHPPHLRRFGDRLPDPIEVEGRSHPVYLKDEIVNLKKEIDREKAAKQKASKA